MHNNIFHKSIVAITIAGAFLGFAGLLLPSAHADEFSPLATATVVATNIVCDFERDLPNWGDGSPDITASTASSFLSQRSGCRLQSGWNFQWGPYNASDPGGSFVGEAGSPWTTFGPTNANGVTQTTFVVPDYGQSILMREVLQSGYLEFSFSNFSNSDPAVSAEIYCSTDGANYDNYDYVVGPQAGNTYYCVAFNTLKNASSQNNNQQNNNQQNNNQGNIASVQTYSASNLAQASALLNGQVNTNGSDVQMWFEYGVNQNFLNFTTNPDYSNGNYNRYLSQAVNNLLPGTTYYFRAAARPTSGGTTMYGQTLTFTTTGQNTNQGQTPATRTNPATTIFQNSGLINGEVNPNGGITNGWFEYGPSVSMGLRTSNLPMGSGNSFSPYSFVLTGLLPNTTYYFRAAAQNQYGINYGTILSFQTSQVVIVPPSLPPVVPTPRPPVYVPPVPTPPSPPPTVVLAGSPTYCVLFIPTLNPNDLLPGTQFSYTIAYQNGCPTPLTNATLRIFLPAEIDLISSSNPFFTRNVNELIYTIGTIPQGGQGSVTLTGTVKSTVRNGDAIIFNSNLEFNLNRQFHTMLSYLTTVVKLADANNNSNLLGSILSLFDGGGWLFWLLVIIILLLTFMVIWFLTRGRDSRDITLKTDPLKSLRI